MDGVAQVRATPTIHKEDITERIAEMTRVEPQERPHAAMVNGYMREQMVHLVSVQAFFNSVNNLRVRAGAKEPPLGDRVSIFLRLR